MTIRVRGRAGPPRMTAEQAAAATVPAMNRLGARITARARTKVNVRSGELRDSIGHRAWQEGPRARLRVFATAPHAKWVHDGTRAHEIRPRYARALRFYWPRVGGVVFRQRVWHPGYRGNPFLRDAVREEVARGLD